MRRSMLGVLLLTFSLLSGCDGGGSDGPGGGPAGPGQGAASGPIWQDEWTLGFVGTDERPASPDAYFVRLVGVRIGGNFDDLGDEEVRFSIESRGKGIAVGRRSIALPYGTVEDVSLEGTPFLELYPGETVFFVVQIDDADVTEYERITSAEIRLAASDFPATEVERTFPALPIRSSGRTLDGASVTLSLVRSPRRDAQDPDALDTARRLFAEFRSPAAPRSESEASELARRLGSAAREALIDAGSSLHTYRRALLTHLARAAGNLTSRADDLAAAGADSIREKQGKLAEALAKMRSEGKAEGREDELRAASAIAERPIPDELDARFLDDFLNEIGRVRASYEAAEKADREFRRNFFWATTALKDLAEAATRARSGLGRSAGFEEAWRDLQQELQTTLPE